MDRNISIISIPDSDTSACGGGLLNETFSPKAPVTPKRESPATLDTTFTPDDKKAEASKEILNETYSPVKQEQPPPPPSSAKKTVIRQTPKKKLPVSSVSFDSPLPNPPSVPEIVVVPPTVESKPLRRSVRTPAKVAAEPVVTRASTRRNTRQTPVKAAATPVEKKRGRKSKKDLDATVETAVPMEASEDVEDEEGIVSQMKDDDQKIAVTVDEQQQKDTKVAEAEQTGLTSQTETFSTAAEVVESPKKKIKMELEEKVPHTEIEKEIDAKTETLANEGQTEDKPVEGEEDQPMEEDVEAEQEVYDDDDEEAFLDRTQERQPPMFGSEFLLPKSIRKRSLSVTDMNPPMPKRNFRVQFHSPGNMEKTITEIDESLYLNFTKSFASSFSIPTPKEAAKDDLTLAKQTTRPVRRKRSLSNAETPVDKLATMQFLCDKKAATGNSGGAKKVPTPSPRKKMPNFAAIHQSIFQQMESLVDFKERKKERAQFLLSSVSPAASAGVMPKATIAKPVNRGAIGKAQLAASAGGIKKTAGSTLLKAKNRAIARKPVSAAAGKMTEKKLAAILQVADIPGLGDVEVQDVREEVKEQETEQLAVKPEETKENVAGSEKASKLKVPRVYNKDANVKPKPFATVASLAKNSVPAKTKDTPARAVTLPKFPVKAAAVAAGVVAPKVGEANAYKIVKGVRMNRRFELMMKHRNNKTTDKN